MEDKNKYYIRLDEMGRIVQTFSDVFFKPTDNDILVGEGRGSQFVVEKGVLSEDLSSFANVENGLQLFDENGIFLLKYEKGVICKISDKEFEESMASIVTKPTELELLKEENLKLMEVTTNLFEQTIKLEEQNLDLMMAITDLYEMSL